MNQNEQRADRATAILARGTDNAAADDGTAGLFTDMSDLIADLIHLCARAGLDFEDVVAHAETAAAGDLEDGPEARRDTERWS